MAKWGVILPRFHIREVKQSIASFLVGRVRGSRHRWFCVESIYSELSGRTSQVNYSQQESEEIHDPTQRLSRRVQTRSRPPGPGAGQSGGHRPRSGQCPKIRLSPSIFRMGGYRLRVRSWWKQPSPQSICLRKMDLPCSAPDRVSCSCQRERVRLSSYLNDETPDVDQGDWNLVVIVWYRG